MSSRIDSEVVDARLRDLSHRLQRVAAKKPASLKLLAASEDLQDILARNLTLAIQAALDIAYHLCAAHEVVPATSGDAFVQLAARGLIERDLADRLVRAVGFRNVLVHEYTEVDWKIVMRVMRTDVRYLASFGRVVVTLLDNDP